MRQFCQYERRTANWKRRRPPQKIEAQPGEVVVRQGAAADDVNLFAAQTPLASSGLPLSGPSTGRNFASVSLTVPRTVWRDLARVSGPFSLLFARNKPDGQ
jgi:hypothetical protein